MDLKLKGTSWAGNFYHKFEKVCNGVDNMEAVKYFENQVQTMGQNMKKFCSDVISDMLHPSMDPVEHDVQKKSLKRSPDIYSLFESVIDIDESHEDKMDEQSYVQPIEFDPLKKKCDAVLNWFHLLEQMNALPNMGPLEGADSNQAPRQPAVALTNSNSNLKYEESDSLAKGYEQLAIWFGDAEIGSNNKSMQSFLPSTTATGMGCENLQTEVEGDSGWEFL
ncbi:hypothetical protein SLA2020_250410 [Shorea laevis]